MNVYGTDIIYTVKHIHTHTHTLALHLTMIHQILMTFNDMEVQCGVNGSILFTG